MNSSDDDDIVEIESSTDSEGNLYTKNQSEVEDTNSSQNVKNDTSVNEAKESERQTSKWQMKANNFADGAILQFFETGKKAAETIIPKPKKRHGNPVVKKTEEKIKSAFKAQKWLQVLAAK